MLGEGYGVVFFVQKYFFGQVRILIFFCGAKRDFFPEFNFRLYDKSSESNYFFPLHQNQNIFSATLGIRMFKKKSKKHSTPLEVKCFVTYYL